MARLDNIGCINKVLRNAATFDEPSLVARELGKGEAVGDER